MGRDKASLPVDATPADPTGAGQAHAGRESPEAAGPGTLAGRTASLLAGVCSPVVEVGPGHTGWPAVMEDPPGGGPLAAMAAGWEHLSAGGWSGPVLVVATDLPRLNRAMLEWLAGHPSPRSVVPVAAGRVQPLCARYAPADMDLAAGLVARGRRAVAALLEAIDPELAPEEEWATAAGGDGVLTDVDTPEDLRRVTGR